MERNVRNFDYGRRGYYDTTGTRPGERDRSVERRSHERLRSRVTARYNSDYVYGGRGCFRGPDHGPYRGP